MPYAKIFVLLKRRWVVVLLSLFVMILLLVKTHVGNRVMVSFASSWVSELNVSLKSGRLLSGGIVDFTYKTSDVSVSARDFRLSLDWFDCATLCLKIAGSDIKVIAADSTSTSKVQNSKDPISEPKAIKEYIALPVSIGIQSFNLERVELKLAGMSMRVNGLELEAYAQGERLNVSYLTVEQVSIINTEAAKAEPFSVPAHIAPIAIPSIFVPLHIEVDKAQLSRLTIQSPEQVPVEVQDINLTLTLSHQQARIEQFRFTHKQMFSYADLSFDLISHVIDGAIGVSTKEGAAVVALKGSANDLVLHGEVSGLFNAELNIQASPTTTNWPFQLNAEVSDVALPEIGELSELKVLSRGDLNNYRAEIAGSLNGHRLAQLSDDVRFDIAILGSLSQLTIDKSRISVADAFSELSSQISWQNGIVASAQGRLFELPLPGLGIEEAAKLSGHYELQFTSVEDSWQVYVDSLDLQGVVADQPLAISFSGQLNEHYLGQLERAKVQYGDSTLKASGSIGEQLDLAVLADINHSANRLLPLDAVLKSDIAITGKLKAPVLAINTAITEVVSDEFSLQKGTVKVQLDATNNYQGRAELDVADFSFSQFKHAQVQFLVAGNRAAHEGAITVNSPQLSLSANLSGGVDEQTWRGTIDQSTFEADNLHGKLSAPIILAASPSQINVAHHCWQLNEGKACAKADVSQTQSVANFELENIPLATLGPKVSDQIALGGELNGYGKVAVRQGVVDKVDSKLWINEGQVTLNPEGQSTQDEPLHSHTLAIEELEVVVQASKQALEAQWHIAFNKLGLFKGVLSFADIYNSKQVSGQVQIDGIQLDELTAYARAYTWPDMTLNGGVNGTVNFSGDLKQPNLLGKIQAQHVRIESSYLPIQLTNLDLVADFDEHQVNLAGKVQTPQSGNAHLSGLIDWQSDVLIEGRIKGEQLFLRPMSGVQLAISPDLTMRYDEKLLDLQGVVEVPFARVQLDTLPEDAILVTDDQVFLDDIAVQDQTPYLDYQADIDIKLLDDVRVIALGLDAYLAGALDIERQVGNALLMGGEVSLLEGKYTAFGQDLVIETGQLGFNGPPDMPYLNIRAIRNPDTTADNVIAGVAATGSIASPQLTIFAEPAMDQARALEYLLNGAPFSEGDSGNNTLLAQLLLAKGIDKSKGLFTKAGKKLGLRDINLAAKGSGDDTQVELSGYITPSVQVSYRVGVFASLSEIAVRYRVFSKLYLEATSGLYDSIDLLYKFNWGD
ncbi:translocation/assembly module TamB domain-containing protein [Pseudoalteromonas luteoviolacea]|uniref:translocation/assembly module TamB domain-containing protein n=1 Tax=Pseudoalteromonas luteoviolacea TaxID=43657 RepID=UPI001B3A04C7|nr:translocation/assembly module TamB domain-containing protein [Pseudoalteromonas luteoviolacea]MBQ4879907.1 translocation/assembly module TamB domain-containing protein [Pseudoalteromonas luteoviolacea]MBQ4908935.1 translocation/assembly module TamB domain-containing protein [Pseudoalteromonas luteoviolacea]